MVKHLLSLITPHRTSVASPSSPPADNERVQNESIRGSVSLIAKLLNPPFHRALLTETDQVNPTPSLIRHQQTHAATPSIGSSSPVRTRKNRSSLLSDAAAALNLTPRRGAKAKKETRTLD